MARFSGEIESAYQDDDGKIYDLAWEAESAADVTLSLVEVYEDGERGDPECVYGFDLTRREYLDFELRAFDAVEAHIQAYEEENGRSAANRLRFGL